MSHYGRWPRTVRPSWASPSPPCSCSLLTPLVGRLAPLIGGLDDKADRPRVHKGAIPRIGGLAIVAGILIPTAILIDLDGPYLGIFIGTLLVAALGLFDDLKGVTPSRKLVGVTRDRADPGRGLRRGVRPRDAAGHRRPRPRLGRVSADVLWIAFLANLVNLIDGMDSLAAGIVAIAAARVRDPLRLVRARRRRGAVGDRVRRDAGVPVPQLPPGEDLHGRLGGARAGLPARDAGGRRRAQDGRRDHAGGAAAGARRADPRHLVRGAQAAQVPPAAVARGPQPLLPPVHAHRLLAAAHRRLPAPVGADDGRLRPAGPLRRRRARAATGTSSARCC